MMNAQPATFASFDSPMYGLNPYDGNMELIMDIPLTVTVEIGRAKWPVQDVLDLGEGSIIELEKQSAEPVDVYVNGHLVARGSVVVIDENFAVRITEIVSQQEKLKVARNK